MKSQRERLADWVDDLNIIQMKTLIIELVEHGVNSTEDFRFWDDSLAPYWECTGDPLVYGQKCFDDE